MSELYFILSYLRKWGVKVVKWRRLGRRIKKYLLERITLTFVPHAKSNARGIHVPRFALILTFLVIFGYLCSVTYLYRNYQSRFLQAQAIIIALQDVKTENITLKAGLAQIAKETEQMRKAVDNLERRGQKIESLISNPEDALKSAPQNTPTPSDQTNKTVNKASYVDYRLVHANPTPLGGGEEYFDLEPLELLTQIREELTLLKAEIPIQEGMLKELESNAGEHAALVAATPKGWPLRDGGQGYITSEYGFRKDPVTGQQAFHEGIDVGVWYGTPVVATAAGKVIYSGWKIGYGRVIIIEHAYGYQTRYGHNSKLVVKVGDRVERGTVIAYSGNSGKSTGPHLHYEVRVNGIPKNPRLFNFKR